MLVVFYDVIRETYTRFGGIISIAETYTKINNRMNKCWKLIYSNGDTKTLKQREYIIVKIEI